MRFMTNCLQEPSLFALLSPWSHSIVVLHSTYRAHVCFLGSNYAQLAGTRGNVLVLLPELKRDSRLVEGMDYSLADRSVHHRSRYYSHFPHFSRFEICVVAQLMDCHRFRLFRVLHLLH